MTDWAVTVQNAIDAAKKVVTGAWGSVSTSAVAQIEAMGKVAAQIEVDYAAKRIDEDDYNTLRSMQKNALEGILSSYEAIGIVAAEQAADAAWNVMAGALKSSIPFA